MKRLVMFATMLSMSGMLVTGCGGAGVPVSTTNEQLVRSSEVVSQQDEVVAQETANSVETTVESKDSDSVEQTDSSVTRAEKIATKFKDWNIPNFNQWKAGQSVTINGYLTRLNNDRIHDVKIILRLYKNGGLQPRKEVQANRGYFKFDSIMPPGNKGDRVKLEIVFNGNSQYKAASEISRDYVLK